LAYKAAQAMSTVYIYALWAMVMNILLIFIFQETQSRAKNRFTFKRCFNPAFMTARKKELQHRQASKKRLRLQLP